MTNREEIFQDIRQALNIAVKHEDSKIGIVEVADYLTMKLLDKFWIVRRSEYDHLWGEKNITPPDA